MTHELWLELREAVMEAECSLAKLLEIVRRYKARGVSQEAARQALESLRVTAGESTDDILLEALDIVTGFCSPQQKIWE